MATHEEWIGRIVQAVIAAQQGRMAEVNVLAGMLEAHEAILAPVGPVAHDEPQEETLTQDDPSH